MARDRAVFAQHEDVVAQHLEVVGRVVARGLALEVAVRHLGVGAHREVAAEAARHPRRVAGVARHRLVRVRELALVRRHVAPDLLSVLVNADGLGVGRAPVVVGLVPLRLRHGVGRLLDTPPAPRLDHRVLYDVARVQLHSLPRRVLLVRVGGDALEDRDRDLTTAARSRERGLQVADEVAPFSSLIEAVLNALAFGGVCEIYSGGEAGGREVGRLSDRAVAVNAVNLDCGARLVVEDAVAVRVLLEVAVNAVHPLLKMYVFEVDWKPRGRRRGRVARVVAVLDRLLELGRRHVLHAVAARVEHVALAVALEDGAEHPAVAVEVCELRALHA